MKLQPYKFLFVIFGAALLLCSCAQTAPASNSVASNSAASTAEKPAPVLLDYKNNLPVDDLCARCQIDHVGNYIWLSEEEIILESTQQLSENDPKPFDTQYFLWNLSTGEIKTLYHAQQENTNPISQVRALQDGKLEILRFGGDVLILPANTAAAQPSKAVTSDPLTTYYDPQSDSLFYFEDQQMKWQNGEKTVSLYTLKENRFPRTLTLSPDKTTFAFSSVAYDALVDETVVIDLKSLTATTISKGLVMPYYCWLENKLCAIENRDEGNTKIYYGDQLEQEILLEFPVPGSGFLYFQSDRPNLGQQQQLIPFSKEFRTETGEWCSEAMILRWEDGRPILETQAVLYGEGIGNLALSPSGEQLLFTHHKAFTGENQTLTILSLTN